MAYTINRRLADLITSTGVLEAGKIPADYITNDHIADNTLTATQLHTTFAIASGHIPANLITIGHLAVTDGTANQVLKTDGSGNLAFTTIEADKIQEGNSYVEVTDTGSNGTITMRTEGTDRWEITSSGNLLPLADDTYDIGSASRKVRDIYVSDGSIKMGTDTVLSINSDGDFEINDAGGALKKMKVDEIEIGSGADKIILRKGSDGKLESREKKSGVLQTARKAFLIGVHGTGEVAEGTNKYFTNARARSAISATGSLSYNSSTGVMSFTMPAQNTSNITEGSNLYYTNARADARITNAGSANWNTAYGWGNHASAGYVTSSGNTVIGTDTDLSFTGANVLSTIALTDGVITAYTNRTLTLANLGYTGATDANNYSHPANHAISVITGLQAALNAKVDDSQVLTNVPAGALFTDTDTNTTYSVGDGGLTQKNFTTALNSKLAGIAAGANNYTLPSGYATETYVGTQISALVDSSPAALNTLNELAAALGDDPNFATTVSNTIGTKWTQNNTKLSQWDTAYGWGNHASAGYTNDQTATEILTAIKTVDGSGSGLDADTVDGIHRSDIVETSNGNSGNLDTEYTAGMFGWASTTTGRPENYGQGINIVNSGKTHNNTNNWITQLGFGTSTNTAYFRGKTNAGSWGSWYTLWHSGNLTTTNKANYDTAYGWGNHASAGYITTDTNTTYSVGNGGLTQINFTSALNSKLSGIATGATNTSAPHYTSAIAVGDNGLTQRNFTNTLKSKLDGIETSATANQTAAEIQALVKTRFYNNAALNSSTTTASFIAELIADYGCFSDGQVTLKVQWSYAGSSDLATGHATIGTIELAGCTIETWGGTYKHIRISRPNTGAGGHMVVEYNDQGSSYAPAWREIWTSESDGAGSGLDADLLDGQQGSHYLAWGNVTGKPTIPTNNNQLTNGSGYTNNTVANAALPKAGGTMAGKLISPRTSINRSSTAASGYNYYSETLNTWQTYMSPAGQTGAGYNGNLTAPSGTYVTSWALRSVVEPIAGYGWTWEELANSATTGQSVVAELSSNTGIFRTIGDHYVGGNLVHHNGNSVIFTSADNSKLDGIAAGANNYSLPSNVVTNTNAYNVTQRMRFTANETNNWDTIATSSGSQGSLEVFNNGAGNDAFMSFHAGADYAGYFGLDADTNDLAWGGWSVGAVKHKMFHAGNSTQFTSAMNTKLSGIATSANNYSLPSSVVHQNTTFNASTSQTRSKLMVWSGGTYGIGMMSGYSFGGLGDYAMSFQMNSDNTRGFWWGDEAHTNAQGAMSLTTHGRLTVASGIRVGYGETDTTTPAAGLAVNGTASFAGVIDANGGHGGINITSTSILSAASSSWTGNPGGAGKIQYHSNRWYIVSDSSSNRIVQFRRDGADKSYIDNDGTYIGNVSGNVSGSSGSCTGNAATATTAANSSLAGGLAVATGTNNAANQIVRTQVNGYIMAGWINTISGTASGGLTRIYCSQDGYIRYLAPAAFMTSIGALNKAGDTTSGTITLGTQNALVANNYGRGLFGLYSSTRYQHVWSMGTGYKTNDSGTSYGNMYGITWTHTNVGTGTNQAISGLGHQWQLRMNGTLHAAIGSGIWTSGNITAYSDIAVKKNLVRIPNALEKVCSINGYTYERTDYVKDLEDAEAPDVMMQAGVVAQEIEKVLPEVVSGKEGNKAVAYGNIVALLIESIKELKDEVDELKKQLKEK